MRDALAPAVLVLLLYAGYIKGSPALGWVPVDLTALAAVAVAGGCAVTVLARGYRLPRALGVVIALFACFLPAVAWSSDNPYAVEKVTRLFTLTLLCAVAGVVLVNNRSRVWWLAGWFAVAGVAMAALLRWAPSTQVVGTVTLEGSNTINLGRAAGAGLLAVGALMLARKVRWWVGLPVGAVLAGVMVDTGARGPLAAVVVAAVVAAVISGRGSRRLGRLVAVTAGLAVLGAWAWASTSEEAAYRIRLLFADDRGASVEIRLRLLTDSAGVAWSRWEGTGWGDLTEHVATYSDAGYRVYPHNAVVEAFVEGGVLAGVALVVVLVLAWRRASSVAADPAGTAVFALFVYWTANAMVSGDLNDNRAVFALIGVALMMPLVLGGEPRIHRSRRGGLRAQTGGPIRAGAGRQRVIP